MRMKNHNYKLRSLLLILVIGYVSAITVMSDSIIAQKPERINYGGIETKDYHFADWNDFYTFFTRTAGIPPRNAEKIQQFFNDLREDFVELVKQYNNNIRHFADIHRGEEPNTDFENQVVNQMKEMMSSKSKENKSDFNMYN